MCALFSDRGVVVVQTTTTANSRHHGVCPLPSGIRPQDRTMMNRGGRSILFAFLLSPAICLAAADGARLLGRVTSVADGDTLTITADQTRHRIRLHEIDAPEKDQPWSRESRRALADKVDGRYVRVDVSAVDDYGRTVGKVWLGDRDINRELVREGHAWAYRHYLEDRSLLVDEADAKATARGLWRLADPVPPWQWRRAARSASAATRDESAGNCDIKGNINRKGERIYHRPDDRDYRQTRIDTTRGERWFCTVEDAESAGWRSVRQGSSGQRTGG
jgi:endonuclease YncB( thermonuclease family)